MDQSNTSIVQTYFDIVKMFPILLWKNIWILILTSTLSNRARIRLTLVYLQTKDMRLINEKVGGQTIRWNKRKKNEKSYSSKYFSHIYRGTNEITFMLDKD